MQAALSRAFLAAITFALSVHTAAAATPQTITFDDATGVGQVLGAEVDPPHRNIGFEGFLWAWEGAGVAEVGQPTNTGFVLGDRSNADFGFVGGSSPLFVVFGSANDDTAYITTAGVAFDFYGAIFSTQSVGTLSIQGQMRTGAGNGNGGFSNVGSVLTIEFDGNTPFFRDITSATALISGVDRLVITASTSGRGFQWAMDDFVYAPVPEASTWAMLGLGLLGVGFAVTRQKRPLRVARR
jgi:hypothetical protein